MAKETRDRLVVGMDLGGTKILAGVVDAKGKILGQAKRGHETGGWRRGRDRSDGASGEGRREPPVCN